MATPDPRRDRLYGLAGFAPVREQPLGPALLPLGGGLPFSFAVGLTGLLSPPLPQKADICCVDKLKFPLRVRGIRSAGAGWPNPDKPTGPRYWVGFRFEGEADFVQGAHFSFEPPATCLCSCCRFQLIRRAAYLHDVALFKDRDPANFRRVAPTYGLSYQDHQEVEDHATSPSGARVPYGLRENDGAADGYYASEEERGDNTTAAAYENLKPMKDSVDSYVKMRKDRQGSRTNGKDAKKTRASGCHYWMFDQPQILINPMQKVYASWRFTGKIVPSGCEGLVGAPTVGVFLVLMLADYTIVDQAKRKVILNIEYAIKGSKGLTMSAAGDDRGASSVVAFEALVKKIGGIRKASIWMQKPDAKEPTAEEHTGSAVLQTLGIDPESQEPLKPLAPQEPRKWGDIPK